MDMKIYVHVNICVFLRLRWIIPSVFLRAILRERMVNIQMERKALYIDKDVYHRFEYRDSED